MKHKQKHKPKSGGSLIHVKFGNREAVNTKRDILHVELGILKIARLMRIHKALRLRQYELKHRLNRHLRELASNIRKIESLLPEVKIPKILQEHEEETKTKVEVKENEEDVDLEVQLREIQDQLKDLGR